MSAKRSVWAMIGKLLWTVLSLALRVAARLGSRWARRRLDEHARENSGGPVRRVLQRRS